MGPLALRFWPFFPLGLVVLYVAALALVDPMRWSLPVRYLVQPFDIYREGFFDYLMCMRVALTPAEARDFVLESFTVEQRLSLDVPREARLCPAGFWPERFTERTLGFDGQLWNAELIEGSRGSSGAVYQNGYLYFWSNNYPG